MAKMDSVSELMSGKMPERYLRNLGTIGIAGQLRFTRADSGAEAVVSAQLDRVPSDPRVSLLLSRCLNGVASPEESTLFQELWQGRVRTLLLDCADDPDIIVVQH